VNLRRIIWTASHAFFAAGLTVVGTIDIFIPPTSPMLVVAGISCFALAIKWMADERYYLNGGLF
jgi:hypothetical protein